VEMDVATDRQHMLFNVKLFIAFYESNLGHHQSHIQVDFKSPVSHIFINSVTFNLVINSGH